MTSNPLRSAPGSNLHAALLGVGERFERAGAISEWRIELSTGKELRQFDYDTISDPKPTFARHDHRSKADIPLIGPLAAS